MKGRPRLGRSICDEPIPLAGRGRRRWVLGRREGLPGATPRYDVQPRLARDDPGRHEPRPWVDRDLPVPEV